MEFEKKNTFFLKVPAQDFEQYICFDAFALFSVLNFAT